MDKKEDSRYHTKEMKILLNLLGFSKLMTLKAAPLFNWKSRNCTIQNKDSWQKNMENV